MPSIVTTAALLALAAGNATHIQQESAALMPAPSRDMQVWQPPVCLSFLTQSNDSHEPQKPDESAEIITQVKTLGQHRALQKELLHLSTSRALILAKQQNKQSNKKKNRQNKKKTKAKRRRIPVCLNKNRPPSSSAKPLAVGTVSDRFNQLGRSGTRAYNPTTKRQFSSVCFNGSPNAQSPKKAPEMSTTNKPAKPAEKSTRDELPPSTFWERITDAWEEYLTYRRLQEHRHQVFKRTEFAWFFP